MLVSEDIRLKSRHTAQQKFQALMAAHEVTASSMQTDEQELDRYHKKTLSANIYRGRDGEVAPFTAGRR